MGKYPPSESWPGKSEEERRETHEELYGTRDIPERQYQNKREEKQLLGPRVSHPRSEKDFENLAEYIVIRHRTVSPESTGELLNEATQTIRSWYTPNQRSKALQQRQFARTRLMDLAKEVGVIIVEF